MMHFFRTPKIVLDAFTYNVNAVEVAPIEHASNYLPDWWKALPKQRLPPDSFFPNPTMKTCVGMHQYYSKSLALPMWSELLVVVENAHYKWQFSDMESEASIHATEQYEGFIDPKKVGHIKIMTPWMLKTKHAVNWLMSHPVYNTVNTFDYTICPGLLDFSKQHAVHVQALINLAENKYVQIPQLAPIAFLTPLTEKSIDIRRHLVSVEEFNLYDKASTPMSFINKYLNRVRNVKKCPYRDHIRTKG